LSFAGSISSKFRAIFGLHRAKTKPIANRRLTARASIRPVPRPRP
jgi:hypothetical protein